MNSTDTDESLPCLAFFSMGRPDIAVVAVQGSLPCTVVICGLFSGLPNGWSGRPFGKSAKDFLGTGHDSTLKESSRVQLYRAAAYWETEPQSQYLRSVGGLMFAQPSL